MKYVESSIKSIKEFLDGFQNMIKDLNTKGKRIKQIPNLLTLSRVGFAFIIPPVAITGNLIGATILTICAILTDALDGFAARKLNAISEFGKNLDPVCDKIFAAALLFPLIGNVSSALSLGLGINILLELGIALVNVKSKIKGNIPRTTILGKIKTATLSGLIATLYLSFTYQSIIALIPFIYALTVIIQSITLVNYNQIDKKKDIKFNKNYVNSSKIAEKKTDKKVIDYFLSKKYTSSKSHSKTIIKLPYDFSIYSIDDYKNLKEEIVRLTQPTIENDFEKENTDNGFQKIK